MLRWAIMFLVVALIALVGVVVFRGVFGIPILAPEGHGVWGDVSTAWLMGAGRVIVTDHLDYRLDFVRRWAQCETFNFTQVEDVVVFCKKIPPAGLPMLAAPRRLVR